MFMFTEMKNPVYAVDANDFNIYKVKAFRQMDDNFHGLSYTVEQVLTTDYLNENSTTPTWVTPDSPDYMELTVFYDESLKERLKDEGLFIIKDVEQFKMGKLLFGN